MGAVGTGRGRRTLAEDGCSAHDDQLGQSAASLAAGGTRREHSFHMAGVNDLAVGDTGHRSEGRSDGLVTGDDDGATCPALAGGVARRSELAHRLVPSRTERRHHGDGDAAETPTDRRRRRRHRPG